MSVSYTCPNPACGVTLKTPNRMPAGKKVKCPKCNELFVAEAEEPAASAPKGPGTFKFADDDPAKKTAPPPPPPPSPAKKPFDDHDEDPESVRRGYGVVKETEAEAAESEKNKPKFGELQDKYKKSARGPAIGLLVMPSNLLTFEGLVTAIGGLGMFIIGMWPLVFNDGAPSDDEIDEAIITMVLGLVVFFWGCIICFGASQMQELSSYTWAMAGAVMGIIPLLVGIYGIVMLMNPQVKAGFEESEGGPDDSEDADEQDDDEKAKAKSTGRKGRDADDDDDDDDDDD